MTQIYLAINAAFYLLFGVLCLIKFEGTTNFLGYSFLNNSGKVEYMAVYGGMELGFAVFYAFCAAYTDMTKAGLIFSVAIYAGICITRTLSALYLKDIAKGMYMVGTLEYTLLLWGAFLLYNEVKG